MTQEEIREAAKTLIKERDAAQKRSDRRRKRHNEAMNRLVLKYQEAEKHEWEIARSIADRICVLQKACNKHKSTTRTIQPCTDCGFHYPPPDPREGSRAHP